MRIREATIPVADVDEAARFWAERLDAPVVRTDDGRARVAVGDGVLVLREAAAGCEHLAITVPVGAFDAMRHRLQQRLSLLTKDGRTVFDGPPSWRSRSVYFAGPSRSVLELIARERDPGPDGSSGDPAALLRLSEVGVAVPDVPAAAAALAAIGVHPFGDDPGATFGAFGDDEGLLILAAEGRPWLPTDDRPATPTEVEVVIETGTSGEAVVGSARIRAVA